jgi:transposase
MLYAGIDIHKKVFQAVVLDPDSGELSESRFEPSPERLGKWTREWEGKLAGVAIEATTGWRWVARELEARGFEVHLLDAGRASALRGRRRRAKTDKLDARWLALILARDLLSECEAWIPPAEIQLLRDQTRLRKSLVNSRTGWAQRLHSLLAHEGWPCSRGRLLTREGRRWVTALELDPAVRAQVDVMLTIIEAFDEQIRLVEGELRRFSRRDSRCLALQTIFGVGPIFSCHLLAEIGDATRFKRSRQLVRLSGLDPAVLESADNKRRGRLSRQGSPHLRWALVEAANHSMRTTSPDHALYTSTATRCGRGRARLTVARKIARRAYHVLVAVEAANLDATTVA